jgi:choline dehydrogenase-like flavoprotein
MLWNRGDREDYDIWSQLNDAKDGWDYDSLLEFFQRASTMLLPRKAHLLTI